MPRPSDITHEGPRGSPLTCAAPAPSQSTATRSCLLHLRGRNWTRQLPVNPPPPSSYPRETYWALRRQATSTLRYRLRSSAHHDPMMIFHETELASTHEKDVAACAHVKLCARLLCVCVCLCLHWCGAKSVRLHTNCHFALLSRFKFVCVLLRFYVRVLSRLVWSPLAFSFFALSMCASLLPVVFCLLPS